MTELTDRQKELLSTFEPKKPLIVNCGEIESFKETVGRFVFKRPTVQDRINISVIAAKEKAGLETLDTLAGNLIFILATFDVVVTERPQDILFRQLFELDGIFDLYERYNEWLDCFRLSVQKEKA